MMMMTTMPPAQLPVGRDSEDSYCDAYHEDANDYHSDSDAKTHDRDVSHENDYNDD